MLKLWSIEMTHRFVFGVSAISILISLTPGAIYFFKISESWMIWAQQSFLWTGLLAGGMGHVLKLHEKRVSKLEKQIAKSVSV